MGRAPEQPFSYEKTLSIIAIPSSRGSSRPRDRTWTSNVSCIGKRFFTISTTWEAQSSPDKHKSKWQWDYHLPPARMAIIKKTGENNCWQRWRKGSPHALLVGTKIGAAITERKMKVSQQFKNRMTKKKKPTWSSNATSAQKFKIKLVSQRDTCTSMFITALFTIAKKN